MTDAFYFNSSQLAKVYVRVRVTFFSVLPPSPLWRSDDGHDLLYKFYTREPLQGCLLRIASGSKKNSQVTYCYFLSNLHS